MGFILDTDIDMDCDDAGALMVLHASAKQGRADILGIICSAPTSSCVPYVRAVNAWYDRDDIPVAGLRDADWPEKELRAYRRKWRGHMESGRAYTEVIGQEWLARNPAHSPAKAVPLYRQLLAAQPDQSVTICTIGFLTAVARLLESGPDESSPLTGDELVAAKVKQLVMEATALFPAGHDVFNWKCDLPSAAVVLRDWPDATPIVISALVYTGVYTGKRFPACVPAEHPVRRAYEIYLGGADRRQHCADLLAVLYAINGPNPFYEVHRGYDVHLVDLESGRHEWRKSNGARDHAFLSLAVEPQTLADHLESLMISSLR